MVDSFNSRFQKVGNASELNTYLIIMVSEKKSGEKKNPIVL